MDVGAEHCRGLCSQICMNGATSLAFLRKTRQESDLDECYVSPLSDAENQHCRPISEFSQPAFDAGSKHFNNTSEVESQHSHSAADSTEDVNNPRNMTSPGPRALIACHLLTASFSSS